MSRRASKRTSELGDALRGTRGTRLRLAGVLFGSGFRAAPGLMTFIIVTTLVSAVALVVYPISYRVIIDAAARHDGTGVAAGVGMLAGLFTIAWVCGLLGAMQNTELTDRTSLYLGVRTGRLIDAAPSLEHFERPDLLREIDQLRDGRRGLSGAPRQLLRMCQVVIRGGGTVILLATVYPPVLVVPLVALFPAVADRMASRLQKRTDDELAVPRRLVEDLFAITTAADTAKELRTYGATDDMAAMHADLCARITAKTTRASLRSSAIEATGWLLYAAGFVLAIVVLVLRAVHGHASVGQVVMAVSLVRRAQVQVASASDTAGAFAGAIRTARRMLWLEDYVADAQRTAVTPAIDSGANAPSGSPDAAAAAADPSAVSDASPGRVDAVTVTDAVAATPLQLPDRLTDGIRFDRVGFSYPGSDREVLHAVDLHLPAGASVAVVGANGAGKSTLVKLLMGLYRPTTGRILLDGADLAASDPAAWRARTSGAFQDFVRFQLVAREAVGVGDLPRIADDAVVRAALDRADAGALADDLAEGLDTRLGRMFGGGRELSGGQWQRLALARGLMREAPLLTVLDEPTASLDAPTEHALFQRYAHAARRAGERNGAITVLVSHRFSTVRVADLIVVVDDGRVVEVGDHDTLLAADGSYAQLFTLQARAYLADG
jgi:ATP-binding cassette subfamily B protein